VRLLVATFALLMACTPPVQAPVPTPRVRPATEKIFVPPAGFVRLRVAVPPVLAKESLEQSYAKLLEYLSRHLGVPVELVVGDSYDDVVTRTAAGAFDAAVLTPYTYARVSEKVKLSCLVQMLGDGSATAAGYIVVREDSQIRSLGDLPGTRFGFVDRSSTSGYLYAVKAMLDAKLEPRRHLGSTEFLGNHEAVLQAVLEGRVDAGATYQGALVALKRSAGIDPLSFRVIAKTARTPRDIVCVQPTVPAEVQDELRRLLLLLTVRDRAGREILSPMNVNGFQPPDDAAYDEVRGVAAAVRAYDEGAP